MIGIRPQWRRGQRLMPVAGYRVTVTMDFGDWAPVDGCGDRVSGGPARWWTMFPARVARRLPSMTRR